MGNRRSALLYSIKNGLSVYAFIGCLTILQLAFASPVYAQLRCAQAHSSHQAVATAKPATKPEIGSLSDFGKAMTEGMLLNPAQPELFEIYRKVYFGDDKVSVDGKTLKSVTDILQQHPDLQKPHFREYEIKSVEKIYQPSPDLSKFISNQIASAGQMKSNLFNPLANSGFWKKLLQYKEQPMPENLSKEDQKQFKQKSQERFTKYLGRIISTKNIELLNDSRVDYQPKIKTLFQVLGSIMKHQQKLNLDSTTVRQAMVDLIHITGFQNAATVELLKSKNATEKLDGMQKVLDERDSMAMDLGYAGHFVSLKKNLGISTPSVTGSADEALQKKLNEFQTERLQQSFEIKETDVIRVRSLSIQEAPFRSCLGGSDCSTRTYFSKALDPNYNYFTMTDSDNHSTGHVTVVLGRAQDLKSQRMIPVAFVDKLQNVPTQKIPIFLEAVRRSLAEGGYALALPENVGDHNGMSNMDVIRNFVATEINPKLTQVAVGFVPNQHAYQFENAYSRANEMLNVKIYQLPENLATDVEIQQGREYRAFRASADLSKENMVADVMRLKDSKNEEDILKFISSIRFLRSFQVYSEESLANDMDRWMTGFKNNFRIRKAAFNEWLLEGGTPDIRHFSPSEKQAIIAEISQWKNSSDLRRREYLNNFVKRFGDARTAEDVDKILGLPGADINGRSHNNGTPLMVAVRAGHMEVIEKILSIPDVQINANGGAFVGNALSIALSSGNYAAARKLLARKDIDVNSVIGSRVSPLMFAMDQKIPMDIFEAILNNPHIKLNELCDGNTALLRGLQNPGGQDRVLLLLAKPSLDINKADLVGLPPLYMAMKYGQNKVVERLFSRSDLSFAEYPEIGFHSLQMAMARKNDEWARQIWNNPTLNKTEVLKYAAEHAEDKDAKSLFELARKFGGFDINTRIDTLGNYNKNITLLTVVAKRGSSLKGTLETILTFPGVDMQIRDGQNLTPRAWARKHNSVIEGILRDRGAEL